MSSPAAAAAFNTTDHEHEGRLLAVILTPRMFEACIGCATAGILLFMCIYGLNLHLETPKELRQGRRFYVATSFIILISHSLFELPAAYYIFYLLYKASNWQETYLLLDELNMTWWSIVSNWASMVLVWVGDGLLVYRCHVIWMGRPMVTVLSATVYLATVGVSIFTLVASMTGNTSWDAGAAWIFLSVSVNCIVTFLISFRLLQMRRLNAAVMGPSNSKVYIGVISILVESALPLALLGIVVASTNWVNSQSSLSMHNVFLFLWTNFSALAPALIIFRVAAGRSWDHNTRDDSYLSTLAFQPRTSQSSEDTKDTAATPLDVDIEKNNQDRVLHVRDQIPG